MTHKIQLWSQKYIDINGKICYYKGRRLDKRGSTPPLDGRKGKNMKKSRRLTQQDRMEALQILQLVANVVVIILMIAR